jgi:hypothetical protein
MATSSWRLEDLHQLEELGLAGQLESTRLQEEGAKHDGGGTTEYSAEPDLNSVLSDLLMTPTLPLESAVPPFMPTSSQPVLMEAVLMAPTANLVKSTSPEVTYVNKGQLYGIRLNPCIQDVSKYGTYYKCVINLGFSELRMRNNEREILDAWSQDHPCERLLDIDRRGCEGVSHIKDSENLNSLSFLWQPTQSATISVKINCLSSEFAAKKHG